MKNVFALFLTVAILAACNKENEVSTIVGTWELTEILIDPGDGSGAYEAVDSDKTIEFLDGVVVNSNGSLCFMTTDADPDNEEIALYDLVEKTITIEDCNGMPLTLFYEIEGAELFISYPCFEPCALKFLKAE